MFIRSVFNVEFEFRVTLVLSGLELGGVLFRHMFARLPAQLDKFLRTFQQLFSYPELRVYEHDSP